MRLKHMVKDKINYRATGKRNFLTRQTNQGRANDGGLKIGEMERDGIMANGLSYFLNESYMIRGDEYYMAICNKSGAIAVYNSDKNLFLSPFADGPIIFNKNVEGQLILDAISKFGRSFSIVRIPFALKLLIQELQTMNVQMRIITEDNIDQLTNLSYQSENINKLLQMDEGLVKQSVKEIVEAYKKSMEKKLADSNPRLNIKNNDPIEPQDINFGNTPSSLLNVSPDYPSSPEYPIPHSPEGPPPPLRIIEPVSPEGPPPRRIMVPHTPSDTPPSDTPPSDTVIGGGIINIFPEDENMNTAFNFLNGESQAKILQMEPEQRKIIMQQIILKSGRQSNNFTESSNINMQNNISGGNSLNNSSPLTKYFSNLPIDSQLGALQSGYKSVSTQFGQLAGQVGGADSPLVTIKKPELMQTQINNQLPLLKPTTNTLSNNTSNESNSSSNESTSSSDNNTDSKSNFKVVKL
jgi:hypothetical protein